jgi:DNA-binding NarL/FixJ family response regulator
MLYDILKNYHWMIKEIQRLSDILEDTEFNGTAQYGLEATLPKAKGNINQAIVSEVTRRTEKSERLQDYVCYVSFINENKHKIKNERERVVLDCLLDGMSLTAISRHLNMSRQHITDLRERIMDILLND